MQTILVLGAFGLVGYEVSKHLLSGDCNVIILSHSTSNHTSKINELKSYSNFVFRYRASSETSVLTSIAYLRDSNIRLTGVVNAVSYRPSLLASTSTDVFKDVVLNSSLAIYLPSKLYGDYLASQDGGSIINFSSIYGLGSPLKSLYTNTNINTEPMYPFIKGGILSISRYFASYYADQNVRYNCISPGGIANNQELQFVQNYSRRVPMERLAFPSEICSAVDFLLSPSSSYVTGINVPVDGGWSAT